MNFELVSGDLLSKADSRAFNWTYRDNIRMGVVPTYLCFVDGELYFLNNFGLKATEGVLVKNVNSVENALHFSVTISGLKLNVVELSNVFSIICKFGGDFSKCEVFGDYFIGGNNQLDALRGVTKLPENIKKFLASKEIPLKSIILMLKLKEGIIAKIDDIILKSQFSVSEFRSFINDLKDYQDEIDTDEDIFREIDRVKSKYSVYKGGIIDKIYNKLSFDNRITVVNKNNFETPEFTVSFRFKDPMEYKEVVEQLACSVKKIEEVYNFMRENDICS